MIADTSELRYKGRLLLTTFVRAGGAYRCRLVSPCSPEQPAISAKYFFFSSQRSLIFCSISVFLLLASSCDIVVVSTEYSIIMAMYEPAPDMPRTFVLCFDGTGNKFHADSSDSNVLKIFRVSYFLAERKEANCERR